MKDPFYFPLYENSIKTVVIMNGVTNISSNSFKYCSMLKSITIPNSVISISNSAFEGCESLTIKCKSGSYAEKYAKLNGIRYQLIS